MFGWYKQSINMRFRSIRLHIILLFLLPRSSFSNSVLVSFTVFGHPLGIIVCFDRCFGRFAAAELEQLLGFGKQRGLEGFVLPIAEPNLHTIIYLVVADV